jgi:ATP-dependent Clp protease adaptor protein ClpS
MNAMSTSTIEQNDTTVRRQPPYHLILLDDNDHTVDYVVLMCANLFGHSAEKAVAVAKEVHTKGRSIVFTGALEVVELKQEQVHAFGPDPLVPRCRGSMTAEIQASV